MCVRIGIAHAEENAYVMMRLINELFRIKKKNYGNGVNNFVEFGML